MNRYRKRPVVVEAFRLGHDPMPPDEWWGDRNPDHIRHVMKGRWVPNPDPNEYLIPTLEGDMTAKTGDWIIKGVKGEVYPCRHDIFLQTYEDAS